MQLLLAGAVTGKTLFSLKAAKILPKLLFGSA